MGLLLLLLVVFLIWAYLSRKDKAKKGNEPNCGHYGVVETQKPSQTEAPEIEKTEEKAPAKSFVPEEAIDMQRARKVYRWMTLAGGTDPLLTPLLKYSEDRQFVIFEKKGYDLWRKNLDEYYNGTVWEEREKALERFGVDLFGEYAEEMKKISNLEYIADDLIRIDEARTYEYDFTLSYRIILNCPWDKINLMELLREIEKTTSILKNKGE